MRKIFILLLLFFLTGCWNYRELNEYAIATGMAIDEKDGKYELSLLFSNGIKENDDKAQVSIYTSDGKTLYEAINNINLSIPKEVYLSHLSVVIISEDLAKKGITPILDYLLRESQSHQNFYILVAKDNKAKNILSVLNPVSDYPSQNITRNIYINEKIQARITDSSFNKFIADLLKKGKSPIINSIILIGDEEEGTKKEEQNNSTAKTYTKLDNLGILENDKLIDYATVEESIGINMLLGDIQKIYLELPCGESEIIITTTSYKIKNKINKDKIKVKIDAVGTISEVGCNIDLENIEQINKLEEQAKNKMEEYINKAIEKAKSLKVDIFGYGNMIYKKYPKYYNDIENWNEYFKNLDIDTNISFTLKEKGALENTIGEIMK